jgi:hypothetical protein
VGVQRKRHAGCRDQRRDEQQRQDAVHTEESMQRGHIGQKTMRGGDCRGSRRACAPVVVRVSQLLFQVALSIVRIRR